MSKLDDAKQILAALQVPSKQQSDMCCYTLLAMAGVTENRKWDSAANAWIRIHEIITFMRDNYGVVYAENSRETIRKQAFLDFKTYKSFSSDLAWETEVWIASTPDHMIHLNGNRFLGPKR